MIKLAVPSKGRLQEQTIAWFASHGVVLERSGSEREYAGVISGVKGVELVLLSAGEIPRELEAGRIHLGVTGIDLIEERACHHGRSTVLLAKMGFGHANLIIAVPDFWADVASLDDLDATAAQFRRTHGMRLRIATKYHGLVQAFLKAQQIADYQLVDSQGATEGVVRHMTAEAIADITSSGDTLRANHLRVLDDGVILRSEASLFLSETAPLDAQSRRVLKDFLAALGADADLAAPLMEE